MQDVYFELREKRKLCWG